MIQPNGNGALTAEDRLDIAETKYLYGLAIDTQDAELLRSVFAEEVLFDMTQYLDGVGAWPMPANVWINQRVLPLLATLDATQHSFSNPIIDVAADDDPAPGEVRLRMQMQAHHVLDPADPESYWTLGGWYDDRLQRSPTGPRGWVISTFALVTRWDRGDRDVVAKADSR